MGYRFNSPPGWPPRPPDWVPPEGWQPDPSWPPPPADWEFWVSDKDPAAGPDAPPAAGASPASSGGGGDGGGGDRPPESRGRSESGGRAQTITLIVAVLGMLGSTLAVLVGDYLEDKSRQQEERRLAYTALKDSADDFENKSAKKILESLSSAVAEIQRDPVQQDLTSKLEQDAGDLETDLDSLEDAYRDVQRKLDGVRLLGSGSVIKEAWRTSEAARLRFVYLTSLNDRFVDVYSSIRDAEAKLQQRSDLTFSQLKRSDLPTLPRALNDLRDRDAWNRQQTYIDLCERAEEYFSAAEKEVNPGSESNTRRACQ
jgi:hypothetical protein